MVSPRINSRRGVLLVDVVVATILLGLALTAILTLAVRALGSQAEGERLQIASMLADEQLNMVLLLGPEGYMDTIDQSGVCEAPFTDYRYEVTFEGGGGADAYDVAAIIRWFDGSRERSIVVETKISERQGDDPNPDRKPKEAVERL